MASPPHRKTPLRAMCEGAEERDEETEAAGAGDELEQCRFPTVERETQAREQQGAEGHATPRP